MMKRRPHQWLLPGLAVLLAACSWVRPAPTPEEVEAAWLKSAHGDKKADSFTHWNKEKPAEIPATCAQCHSTPGYLNFHGADGSAAGAVDGPVPVGTTVECDACHSEVTERLTAATFPSGRQLDRLGGNATCYDCHQGRAAGADVDAAIAGKDLDAVDGGLSFINIHANAAAPIMYGAEGGAGYEYAGKSYAGRFAHVPGFNSCITCHDAHSLRLLADNCEACHIGADSPASLRQVRTSNSDYDGDGDITEGIAKEIDALRDRLLKAMQAYAAQLPGGGGTLNYSKDYPYFLDAEKQPFARWTPRLLRAAYNYHLVTKGGGSFAHNPAYTLQLLYDSIEDLGGDLHSAARPPAR